MILEFYCFSIRVAIRTNVRTKFDENTNCFQFAYFSENYIKLYSCFNFN